MILKFRKSKNTLYYTEYYLTKIVQALIFIWSADILGLSKAEVRTVLRHTGKSSIQ
jgi:hypothetical protein